MVNEMEKEMIARQEALLSLSKDAKKIVERELAYYKSQGIKAVTKSSADYFCETDADYLQIVFDYKINELQQQLVGAESKIVQMETAIAGSKAAMEVEE